MSDKLVVWQGVAPDRIDAASVRLADGSLTARGTSVTAAHALAYHLETGPDWVTRRIRVRVEGGRWWRSLDLSRDDSGTWSATVTGEGDESLGPAGILDPAALRGAQDCDLAYCPLTNTMPVLRHDLVTAAHRGDQTAVDYRMAWISVPDLAVHVSPQRYVPVEPAPGGGSYVRFVSGDFEATLELDRDGLVADYPSIGKRLAPAG